MKIWGTKVGVVPDLKARVSTLTNAIMSLPGALHSTALCSRHAPHRGFCTPSTAQPVWTLERGSAHGLGIPGGTSNNCVALKDICVEAIWCLQVNYYLQSGFYAYDFGIPTLISQSATKYSGVLSVFKNPYSDVFKVELYVGGKPLLDISVTLSQISFHLIRFLGKGIQKYSVPVLRCLSHTD